MNFQSTDVHTGEGDGYCETGALWTIPEMIFFFFCLPRVELYKTSLLYKAKRLIVDAFNCMSAWACVRA